MPRLSANFAPLRASTEFRRLWLGSMVSSIGGQLTIVGIAFQAYELTHSTLIVGMIGLLQLGPTLVGSLGGGAVADAHDRRLVLIAAQVMLGSASAALALNSFLGHPRLWVLFLAAIAAAGFQGLDWPTRNAILPMLLPADQLADAFALQSIVSNGAVVIGPAFAGLLIDRFGVGVVFSVDACSFLVTLLAASLLPALPPAGGGTPLNLRSVIDGLKFLRSERLIVATMELDLAAMTFGMPTAVFPALAVGYYKGGAGTVGLLFSAPGAGALLGSVLSGWVGKVRQRGRALVGCMVVWGATIALLGVIPMLWVGLVMLALAGGSDLIGGIFRVSILQERTPDAMKGRMSGVFFASAVAGNRLGSGESGVAAAIGGSQFAVWSGGLACLASTALLVWRVPELWQRAPAAQIEEAPAT